MEPDVLVTSGQSSSQGALIPYIAPGELPQFLLEPSNPWTASIDRDYTQYFLLKTAPLLSSTRRWQNFWQYIVPQAAWNNASIRHAMIAVTLTFDTYVSGMDHSALILSNRSKAITAFAAEPSSSWEIGLIMCRLFSSMAQCNEDFEGAMTHMRSGEKMLREATRNGSQRPSEVVTLMASTFMGLFADSTIDFDVIKRFPPRERHTFRVLQKMCSEYARLIRRVSSTTPLGQTRDWEFQIEKATMGFMSVVFTTLNQAISSAMYPDVLRFGENEGIVPIHEVRAKLIAENDVVSFDRLKDMYRPLFDDVSAVFDADFANLPRSHDGGQGRYRLPVSLENRLKHFVENFLVHAWILEPRMTAGTFWLPNTAVPHCSMEEHFLSEEDKPHPPLSDGRISSCLHRTYHNCNPQATMMDPEARERREYYHEYVCQYRSGFSV
jgi:hypothetical protein